MRTLEIDRWPSNQDLAVNAVLEIGEALLSGSDWRQLALPLFNVQGFAGGLLLQEEGKANLIEVWRDEEAITYYQSIATDDGAAKQALKLPDIPKPLIRWAVRKLAALLIDQLGG